MAFRNLVRQGTYTNIKINQYDHDLRVLSIFLKVYTTAEKDEELSTIPIHIGAITSDIPKVNELPEKAEFNDQVRIKNTYYTNIAQPVTTITKVIDENGQVQEESKTDFTAKWKRDGEFLTNEEWDERFAFSNFDGTNGKNPVAAIYQYLADFKIVDAEDDL